ncbi:MAG TPA: asparagine synthase (glutamine-hydrolyzing) [bacterium]
MCGIVGYAAACPEPGLDRDFLRRACARMAHRGPDGEGLWEGAGAGLAHRRLSIIDLERGTQPMSYGGGRYVVTYNGELYNYRELRARLAGLGHSFETDSDTEVVLAAFAQWGEESPKLFRGIFAFGIWDAQERRLTLCRDQLGVKPLLYHRQGGRIVFSSEVKAILEAPCVPRDADGEGLADYLALGYPLGERTVLRGIRRLSPGTLLAWQDGEVTARTYWDLAAATNNPLEPSADKARLIREYAAALERAVTSQMVSDVPVGGFLSGGMDSSSVVCHMRGRTPHALQTFSMGFTEGSFSELPQARRVAAAFGTEHHDETVSLDPGTSYPLLAGAFDEPLGDSSLLPTYCVSRLARRHVKVVLTGDGADESLAGYDTYVADLFQRFYRLLPRALHERIVLPASGLIPPSRRKLSLNYRIRQFIAHAHNDLPRAHYGWRLLFGDDERRALLGGRAPGYDPADSYRSYFDQVPEGDPLNRCLYVDMKTWLANDILTKVDRASMAVGLEARVPFLDVDLVEFTMRLPAALKMRGLRRKVVLREAMRGRLPDFVLRRRKAGFNAPVSDWLRGSYREVAEELFGGTSRLVDLDHPVVRGLWQEHRRGERDHGFSLWSLAALLLWERSVLQPPAVGRRAGEAER